MEVGKAGLKRAPKETQGLCRQHDAKAQHQAGLSLLAAEPPQPLRAQQDRGGPAAALPSGFLLLSTLHP